MSRSHAISLSEIHCVGGATALSHGRIPRLYDDAVAAVKLKRRGSYGCAGDLKLEESPWRARIRERFEPTGKRPSILYRRWRDGRCQCSGQQFAPDEATTSPHSASLTTRRPLLSPAKTYLEARLATGGDKVWVIAASTNEELLAAATLRAQIFYSYPQADDLTSPGLEAVKARAANDFLANDLLKTRVKSEFNRESKFEALGMRVKCLLAVCQQSTFESLSFPEGGRANAVPRHLTPPTVASVDTNDTEPLVAIGTLDIQDGTGVKATADVNLVTFQLYALAHKAQQLKKQVHKGSTRKQGVKKGYFPVEQENTLEQAYIFNVCVFKDARRIGVAKALMVAALKVAKQMELQILFVHVEADNANALRLYNSLGYAVEEEEAVEVESLLQQPRRILLSFYVV